MIAFDELEICPVCGRQAMTSREIGQGTTTVMQEQYGRDPETGELLELPRLAREVVTEIIVEYHCNACGHRRQDAL